MSVVGAPMGSDGSPGEGRETWSAMQVTRTLDPPDLGEAVGSKAR